MKKPIIQVTTDEAQEAIQIVYDIAQSEANKPAGAKMMFAGKVILDVETSKRIQDWYSNFDKDMD